MEGSLKQDSAPYLAACRSAEANKLNTLWLYVSEWRRESLLYAYPYGHWFQERLAAEEEEAGRVWYDEGYGSE